MKFEWSQTEEHTIPQYALVLLSHYTYEFCYKFKDKSVVGTIHLGHKQGIDKYGILVSTIHKLIKEESKMRLINNLPDYSIIMDLIIDNHATDSGFLSSGTQVINFKVPLENISFITKDFSHFDNNDKVDTIVESIIAGNIP